MAALSEKPCRTGAANFNWKGGNIAKICEWCKKTFDVPPHRASKARFCAMGCANAFQSVHPYVGPRSRFIKPCKRCGADISVTPALAVRRYFCSQECHFDWRAELTAGKGNPNWQGGLSRLPYPYNWAVISKRIRRRDEHQCQNPHCRGEDKRLTTHHIDFDKMNVSETNLITLCSSCNSRANFNRAGWTAFYNGLQAIRLAQVKLKIARQMFPFRFYLCKKQTKKQGGNWIITAG